jgi:hypothetical protein
VHFSKARKCRVGVFLAMIFCPPISWAQVSSELVVMDRGYPAYTAFGGQPKSRVDVVKAKLAGKQEQVVDFKEFAEGRIKRAGRGIVHDEYVA